MAVAEAAAPPRAVDLGCGKGRDAVYLASRGWSVLVVDRQRASSSRLGAVPELPYRSVLAVDNQRAFLDHVQARCSRDAAEMQPRCGRDAAEMRPRCSRDAAEMQPRCG